MSGAEYGKLVLGIAVWLAVAVFAVAMQATVENQVIGFFAVLAAVIAAWAVGDLVIHPNDEERS